MIPYPEETRQEALKVFDEKGIRAACERFNVPKSSIYRWRRKARQRAMQETRPDKVRGTGAASVLDSESFGRNRSDGRMFEKMLVTQALDERDLLVKKITDKIRKAKLVDTKKRNEERTAGERVTVDEFGKSAQSAWQQIMDLIDRYQRIDASIVASNAATWILDWLRDRIVIPESYKSFLREQYALEVGTQANSVGSFVPLEDGKFTIVEPDKRLLEIWESIITKCDEFPSETVTDDERIEYEVLVGYTWERLFSVARIDKIQLDAFIIAEREKGVFLCDDLFFRKIAEIKGIKNINVATLLDVNPNLDDVMPILMELSKTNYVYTPFRCRNNEEGKQLIQNLLEGEKKKAYYTVFFNAYISVRDQIMKQYFGKCPDETEE